MALKTLGEQLEEIEAALSKARQAISIKTADREVQRSYIQLRQEKEYILAKIKDHGPDYVEGSASNQPRRGAANVTFS